MKHNTKLNAVALVAVACVAAPLAGVLSAYASEVNTDDQTGANTCPVSIGDTCYNTIPLALEDANSETMTIINVNQDFVDADGVKIAEGTKVTIDFGGHTYDIDENKTVGSSGTETNGFQILMNSTVELKNGKITGGRADKLLLQNYAALTLRDIIVDATVAGNSYALSNNYGNISIVGSTSLLATENKRAFDLWYGMFESYKDGVYMTIDTTGKISGIVEYGCKATYGCTVENWYAKAKLTIVNGEFTGPIVKSGGCDDIANANVEISGGKFTQPNTWAQFVVSDKHIDEDGVVVANEVVAKATEVSADVSAPTLGVTSANTLSAQLSKTAALLNKNADVEVKLEAPAVSANELALYYDEIGEEATAEAIRLTEGLKTLGVFNATLKIGNDTISELDEGITLALALPAETVDALKSVPEGKVRKYYVVRIHEEADGSYKVKRFDARLEGNFIVFENDRFSMLLVATELVDEVVEEEAAGEAEEEPEVGDHGAFTAESGSATAMALGTAIMVGIITAVVSFIKLNKRTNEQE